MSERVLTRWQEWGITILRLVVGVVFLAHGAQKLFVMGFGNVAAYLTKVGIPAPMPAAVVLTLVEFLGGLALVSGFSTRWAAALLAGDMAVATLTVHLRGGFFLPSGAEFTFTLFGANVALILLGSGAASVDRLLRAGRARRRPRDEVVGTG